MMSDEVYKKLLAAQSAVDQYARIRSSLSESTTASMALARVAEQQSAIQHLVRDFSRQDEWRRAALGSLAEFQASGLLDKYKSQFSAIDAARGALAAYEANFRLPSITEAMRLVDQVKASGVLSNVHRFVSADLNLQGAIEAMRTPWVNAKDVLQSTLGFAELQSIGQALTTIRPFDEGLVRALRGSLGDWRDRITWPALDFTDISTRTEFYAERGFDLTLTDFPTEAFEASLEISGLRDSLPDLVALYGTPVPLSNDNDEEEGFKRTNTAHDWLQRFETQLRRFIDIQLARSFGDNWPKHRLPNGLYEQWCDKKQKAEQNGASPRPLIYYADFTDYELVICKRDNWREVFEPFFRRSDSVRESLQRLHLPRIATMHSRLITQDDELLVYVEIKRLTKILSI